jgi:hypothetical protein
LCPRKAKSLCIDAFLLLQGCTDEKPIGPGDAFRQGFFSHHLPRMGWKLQGADDVKNFTDKKPTWRTEALIKGLNEGTVYFDVIGYRIGGS